MTGMFDGMAGLLAEVFGAQIGHAPATGDPRMVQGVLRRDPVNVQDEEGRELLTLGPVLRVTAELAADIRRGDIITAPDGTQYTVVNGQPDGSPAADAFTIFELEEI